MAFVKDATYNPTGNRAFALRGLGAAPYVFFDAGERNLRLGSLGQDVSVVLRYPDGGDLDEMWGEALPIDGARVTPSLMPPLEQVRGASWTDWFRQESVIPKVPNWALAGLGGLALMAFLPGGGRKRR